MHDLSPLQTHHTLKLTAATYEIRGVMEARSPALALVGKALGVGAHVIADHVASATSRRPTLIPQTLMRWPRHGGQHTPSDRSGASNMCP
jgi:hypothetical protein